MGAAGRFEAADAGADTAVRLGAFIPDSGGLELLTGENSAPHPGRQMEQAAPAGVLRIACVSVLHADTPGRVRWGVAQRRHWRAWQPLSRSDGRCVRDAGIPKAKAVARGTMRSHPRERLLPTKGITTGLPASLTRAFYHGGPGWRGCPAGSGSSGSWRWEVPVTAVAVCEIIAWEILADLMAVQVESTGFAIITPAVINWMAGISGPRRALDVAAGCGALARELIERGIDVVAADSHPPDNDRYGFREARCSIKKRRRQRHKNNHRSVLIGAWP